MTKTHWKKNFNKDYLGSWDLEDGKDLNTVIKSITTKEVPDQNGKKAKCVVAILDGLKPMILNVTACKQVTKFANSPYTEDWVNIPITLYVQDGVRAFGDVTEALRIRDKQPIKPELKQGSKTWDKAVKFITDGGDVAKILSKYLVSKQDEATLRAL